MALTSFFYVYSSLLPLLPLGCLFYFILQIIITIKAERKFADKKALLFLLSTYMSGFLCGLSGYSLHILPNSFWCESTIGAGFCFAFLGGTKASLYCVFLRRAKSTVIHQFNSSKLKEVIFDKVIPAYLMIYFLVYCSMTTLFFKLKYYDLSDPENDINIKSGHVSFCTFKTWEASFVIATSLVDLMNSIIATLAFVIPLVKIMKLVKIRDQEIANSMKWDVILTFIATISSAISLAMLNPMTGGWMWCFCLVDPFINSSCCFFMMGINREFVHMGTCNSAAKITHINNINVIDLSIVQSKNYNNNTGTKSKNKSMATIPSTGSTIAGLAPSSSTIPASVQNSKHPTEKAAEIDVV